MKQVFNSRSGCMLQHDFALVQSETGKLRVENSQQRCKNDIAEMGEIRKVEN